MEFGYRPYAPAGRTRILCPNCSGRLLLRRG